MGALDRRVVLDGLQAKGFVEETSSSKADHHRYFYFWYQGKKTRVRTRISHTAKHKTLAAPRVNEMAKQCCLRTDQFTDLVQCPLSKLAYEDLLRIQGKLR